MFGKHTRLAAVSTLAATTAAALALSACGSSSKSDSGSGGGGTVASKLIFGGPPEFKTRVDGLPGLQKNYGVKFQSFKTTDVGGPVTVTSLKNGQVDAADLFTTDPAIKANNFVVLTDPKSNFGAQNVVPLLTKSKATPGVQQVLDFVSSKLTTEALIDLRTKVEVNKEDKDQAAKEFLQSINPPTTTPAKGVSIIIGSANFPENEVLADIYGDALAAAGASVTKKLDIGSREKYIPALKSGDINFIPEYSGTILQYLDKNAKVEDSKEVYASLQKALPNTLTVTKYASAEDRDAIVVTQATASKYGLKSIADLAKKS